MQTFLGDFRQDLGLSVLNHLWNRNHTDFTKSPASSGSTDPFQGPQGYLLPFLVQPNCCANISPPFSYLLHLCLKLKLAVPHAENNAFPRAHSSNKAPQRGTLSQIMPLFL